MPMHWLPLQVKADTWSNLYPFIYITKQLVQNLYSLSWLNQGCALVKVRAGSLYRPLLFSFQGMFGCIYGGMWSLLPLLPEVVGNQWPSITSYCITISDLAHLIMIPILKWFEFWFTLVYLPSGFIHCWLQFSRLESPSIPYLFFHDDKKVFFFSCHLLLHFFFPLWVSLYVWFISGVCWGQTADVASLCEDSSNSKHFYLCK